MFGKFFCGTTSALALLLATQLVHGQTLSSLIGAGPVTSGGLVFSNFTETGTLPASGITVTFTPTGVQFTAGWTTLSPGLDSSIIGYNVAPVSGTLSGTTLNISGHAVTNNGAVSVGETVIDTSTNNKYSLQAFFGGTGHSGNQLTDSATFSPEVTSINIIKSIDVAAGDANSSASLNFVENIYTSGSGTPPPVPEPMSLALLPLALGALALRKKLAR